MADRRPLAGKIVALWCSPIKSLPCLELHATTIVNGSLLGALALALIDCETGSVASATHPGRWPRLLACRAAFVEPPAAGLALPPVRVTLPDGIGHVFNRQEEGERLENGRITTIKHEQRRTTGARSQKREGHPRPASSAHEGLHYMTFW